MPQYVYIEIECKIKLTNKMHEFIYEIITLAIVVHYSYEPWTSIKFSE